MSEEFTSLAVAYLLREMNSADRRSFEARVASDPALAAELKEIADGLAVLAEAGAPAPALPAQVKSEMLDEILRARAARNGPSGMRRLAWPLAAVILLGLNLAQWRQHRRDVEARAAAAATEIAPSVDAAAPRELPVIPVAARRSADHGAARAVAAPSIQQTMTFSISQTTVSGSAAVATGSAARQHGSLDLHNLPRIADDRALYLWARRAGATGYEPVGEIPRQLQGTSGTINYELRPGNGAPVHFIVTLEGRDRVPAQPSLPVICAGP